jgi:FtsZ-binding cell division protein ZapB
MIAKSKFEQNVAHSFSRAKSDMYNLYEHIQFLYREIEELKFRNDMLLQKVGVLRDLQTQTKVITAPRRKVQYVTSRTSNKVHTISCVFAKNIKLRNKVVFANQAEALKKGYTQCACLRK